MNVNRRATDKPKVEQAIVNLQAAVDRFIVAARVDGKNGLMKMLECSIQVQPAMEAVVKAVTNT